MTREDVLSALEEVIRLLGTWDITTIRASLGMYLCCRAIHETTDVRVLMTGEISDELFGYKYTDFAPSAEAFQQESKKRIDELHMYDVLRADRCISVNSLEARVPFGDLDFVRYVMRIDPELKLNRYGMGKYLLRHAFEGDHILPDEILWRQKAAFSDAVGHSMVDDLKAYAETVYLHRRGISGRVPEVRVLSALYQGEPAVSGYFREILSRAGGDDCRLLDAEPGMGGMQGGRSLRQSALQLWGKRYIRLAAVRLFVYTFSILKERGG